MNTFEFEALVDQFPGNSSSGHKLPNPDDIESHIPTILDKINQDSIKVIVPLGKLAIQYLLNNDHIELKSVIGNRLTKKPFGKVNIAKTIIPLPHPSGASTWIFQGNNQILLNKALKLIRNEIEN